MKNITVIVPCFSDDDKLKQFCISLFAANNVCELMLCHNVDSAIFHDFDSEILNRIKIFSGDNNVSAFRKAICEASGDFILISHVHTLYAPDALCKMAETGGACVCNIALTDGKECSNLFRDNFTFNELSSCSVYSNYLLNTGIIRQNNLLPNGTSPFEILSFIACYSLYDSISLIHETLAYTDCIEDSDTADFSLCPEYASLYHAECNPDITYFYLRNLLTHFLMQPNKDDFLLIKKSLFPFADDGAVLAWIEATFQIDARLLCNTNSTFEDFQFVGTHIYYKEKTMPLMDNDVVMNFYAGRFGIGTLKRCIAAWAYYKLYRRKNGFIKKVGCKMCKRLLGGDFNA